MAAIVECYPLSPPRGPESGSDSPQLSAWWYVEADEPMPSPLVRALAESASGTGAVRGEPMESLPARGSSLSYSTDSGRSYQDTTLLALDFAPEQADGNDQTGDHNAWRWRVTWRKPDANAGEQPNQIGADPVARPPDYEIFYSRVVRKQSEGLRVLNESTGELAADPEVMRNAAGEPFDPVDKEFIVPTLHIFDNVRSPVDALVRNEKFEDSVNSRDFQVLGLKVRKHYSAYDIAETGSVNYSLGRPYYRRVTKIKLSRVPFYSRFFNQGSYYLEAGAKVQELDRDGRSIPPPFPLDSAGGLATSAADYGDRVYLTHLLRDFRELIR